MAEIVVRDVDDAVVEKLRERAEKAGRSLEAEVNAILEQSASLQSDNSPQVDMPTARRMFEEIREKFEGREFPDPVELIREDRDNR